MFKIKRFLLLLIFIAGLTFETAVSNAWSAEPLYVGAAAVDITPPLGYRMSGYFSERLNQGVKDPLQAKALYFRQGENQAALVFCDMIGVSLAVSKKSRRAAEEKTGVPSANILVAATHSHTGPLYFGALRKHFHDQAVARDGADRAEKFDYPAKLAENIATAIALAKKNARAAQLEAGAGQQQGLSFNRRFHMKNGSVRFNPGQLNPDIVRVAGPIDPEVGLVLLRDAKSNKPFASLTVFALHLDTVGGTNYSADYPYFLSQTLQAKLGQDFFSAFGIGTCGDINHVDVTRKDRLKTDFIGTTLGETVLAQLSKLTPRAASLDVRSTTVQAPLQKYSAEKVEKAAQDMFKIGTRKLSFLEQVEAYKITALQHREGDSLPAEVQVFRLGEDIAVVGLPGEVFVELGLAIKRASPFKTTLIIELCQDAPGYLPTKKAFAEGSYETVNSRIQSGGGEKIVDAALQLLNDLK